MHTKPKDLLKSSYHFELPTSLVAQRPHHAGRDQCKLLSYDLSSEVKSHLIFNQIIECFDKPTLFVFNNSKVFPARVLARKESGAQVEIFVLAFDENPFLAICMLKSNAKKRIGERLCIGKNDTAEIISREDKFFKLKFSKNVSDITSSAGQIPIPHYIRGGVSDELDAQDYQTIYAQKEGSVAAPTAGLHFTKNLLKEISKNGHDIANVCLHVGIGTFSPVLSESIDNHKMHTENFEIDANDFQKIKKAKNIVAVGTTSLRVLETIYGLDDSQLTQKNAVYYGSTNIFLHPGCEVKSIDAIITNFHLPESSLLMLVSALIGREKVLELYKDAITREYLFFSYGDAMILKNLR